MHLYMSFYLLEESLNVNDISLMENLSQRGTFNNDLYYSFPI